MIIMTNGSLCSYCSEAYLCSYCSATLIAPPCTLKEHAVKLSGLGYIILAKPFLL